MLKDLHQIILHLYNPFIFRKNTKSNYALCCIQKDLSTQVLLFDIKILMDQIPKT